MDTNQNKVSSKTLSEKVIMQLMTFNKCTRERAVCMYKEMLQTIADYYLTSQVSSKTQIEIEVFASDVCALHQIIVGGETRRVLVNPSSIYVASATDGGTMVSTIIGTIRVTETPEQIEQKVSLKTQGRTADL